MYIVKQLGIFHFINSPKMEDDIKLEVQNLLKKNNQELRGYILEKTIYIEHRVDKLIIDFFEIDNDTLFREIVLNSVIINSGSKLRITERLGLLDTVQIDTIRKIYSIRNYFAHSHTQNSFTVKATQNGNTQTIDSPRLIRYSNSSLVMKYHSMDEIIKEFITKYNLANSYF